MGVIKNTAKYFALLGFLISSNKSFSQQAENMAQITVIRSAGEVLKHKPMTIYINGEKRGMLQEAKYITFEVKEGEYSVFSAMHNSKTVKDKMRETSLNLMAITQQRYYILMVITDPRRRMVSFTPILENGALKLMKECSPEVGKP